MKKQVKELMLKVVKSSYPIVPLGGQHCGRTPVGVCLTLFEDELEIKINCFRSQHRNLELAYTLMELAIEENLK